jgi:hypothetical protein
MLEEKIKRVGYTSNGRPDLVDVRRANWLLASRSAQQLGDDWDLDDSPFEFLCECGRPGCSSTVELTLSAYVVACSARLLIVSAGHQSPLDLVKERGEGYLVIEQTSGRSGLGVSVVEAGRPRPASGPFLSHHG